MGDKHGNAMQGTSLLNMFILNTRKRGLRDWGLACVARKMVNLGISGLGASLSSLVSLQQSRALDSGTSTTASTRFSQH